MENTQQSLTTTTEGVFSLQGFEHAQRVAKMLAESDLIPTAYRKRVDNCMIALEMANRSNTSPLIVMQNLHIIQGKPSWSSKYVIAMINSCGKYSQELKYERSGEGDDYGVKAWTVSKKDGERVEGPKVTWKMVKEEGWLSKTGSKWKTMPELMFMYRSAAFFGSVHCPELTMGLHTQEEVIDITPVSVETVNNELQEAKERERVIKLIEAAQTSAQLSKIEPDVPDSLLDMLTVKKDQLKAAGK